MTEDLDSKLHSSPIRDAQLKDEKQQTFNSSNGETIKSDVSDKLDGFLIKNVNNDQIINDLTDELTSESKDSHTTSYELFADNANDDSDQSVQQKDQPTAQLRKGKCKWFNSLKGWGFITPNDENEDVFVHQSVINTNGFRGLIVGQEVEFEAKQTTKGLEAVKVIAIEKTGDRKKQKVKTKKIRCFNCGEFTTHLASECDQIPQPKKCHHCKSEDHLIGDCPLRIGFLLFEDEDHNLKSKNQKNELTNKVDLNRELNCKKEQTNVIPSVEQPENQVTNQNSNKEQANESFLDKTTKSLMNYKKLKKKKKSTSSLSNASFSSSSSELSSSSISSKSVSPCPFTHLPNYSNHTNEQQANYSFEEPSYCDNHNNDHYREESYSTNNLMFNQITNDDSSNQIFSNYVQDNLPNNSIPYYDQQFYLPVNYNSYNNNYNGYLDSNYNSNYNGYNRLNQFVYNRSNQINQPYNNYNPVPNSQIYLVAPYDDYNNQPTNVSHSSLDPQLNYCNNYQTNQLQMPMSSQPNKLAFLNQLNSFNNLVRLNNLDSFNCILDNFSCCNSCHNTTQKQFRQFNCQCCEGKLGYNHCSMLLNSCRNEAHCTNHTHQSNHICDLNQIMNHNCCNLKANHFCNHLTCKLNTCNCLSRCKSIHTKSKTTCQSSCYCNQFLKTNLIKNQINKNSDCELQKVDKKKVLDQFETDSGVESGSTRCTTSRCSTATGCLEIE